MCPTRRIILPAPFVPFELPSKGIPEFPSNSVRREFEAGGPRRRDPGPRASALAHATPHPRPAPEAPSRRRLRASGSLPERRFGSGRHSQIGVFYTCIKPMQDVPDTTHNTSSTLPNSVFPSNSLRREFQNSLRIPFEGNSRPTAPADGPPPELTLAIATLRTLAPHQRRPPAGASGSSPVRRSGSSRHSQMVFYMY